jgi:hypothetical protein
MPNKSDRVNYLNSNWLLIIGDKITFMDLVSIDGREIN